MLTKDVVICKRDELWSFEEDQFFQAYFEAGRVEDFHLSGEIGDDAALADRLNSLIRDGVEVSVDEIGVDDAGVEWWVIRMELTFEGAE